MYIVTFIHNDLLQEAQDFLSYYRDVLAKDKMIRNKGIYKR